MKKPLFLTFFSILITTTMTLTACTLPFGALPQLPGEDPEATEEAGPPPIEVLYTTTYVDGAFDYHSFHIAGEVQNISDRPIHGITLTFTAKDTDGLSLITKYSESVESNFDFICLETLMPGEIAPFDYSDTLPEGKLLGEYSVTYEDSYEVYDDMERAELVVEKLKYIQTDYGTVIITGELVNLNDRAVWTDYMTGAAVALVDAEGMVLAATGVPGAANNYLAPAGDPNGLDRMPFYTTLSGPVPNVSTVKAITDGFFSEPRLTERTDIVVDSMYTDGLGTHVLGTLHNAGEEGIKLYWVTALYDAEGYVLNAATPDLATSGLCLDAGKNLPFQLDFPSHPNIVDGSIAAIDHYVIRINPDRTCDFESDLLLEDMDNALEIEDINYAHKVIGTITNSSATAVDNRISVIVYFTNASGAVKAWASDLVNTEGEAWSPGDTAEVDVNIYLQDGIDINALTLHTIVIADPI